MIFTFHYFYDIIHAVRPLGLFLMCPCPLTTTVVGVFYNQGE